ncbi:MAG: glycosyltransferase family 2 protein [Acidobacteria bacterium]|nr:glycosyltransferase family 2 protein [Acidobacteriota bacterium]MBI3421414.1 glycosyltransferase family 2 protein [Acidobacteriota bacterium]
MTIVIVNWNGGELLARCIESVLRQPPPVRYEIVIADNASTDGSLAAARALVARPGLADAPLRFMANEKNLGFAKANNQALAGSAAPYVFLLNPDTEVKPGALAMLLRTLQAAPRIGACAPRLLNSDGSLQPSVWRNPPTVLTILLEGWQLYRFLPAQLRANWLLAQHWDHTERRSVSAFSGAAMMVKREMIAAVGPLDESFEMYGEDGEWCTRMRKQGWQLIFEPAAEVVHHGGQSALKRWTNHERRLQEIDAWFRYQKAVLSPGGFVRNTLAHTLVIGSLRLRRTLLRQPAEYLAAVMQLQRKYLKESYRELFGR